MPTFKGLMPSTLLTPTWMMNDFCNLYFVIYCVVQAHLQRFRVLEVFWCHGIMKNSHLSCLHSAVGSFPLGSQGSWQLLISQGKKPSWIRMKCSALHSCSKYSNTGLYSRQLQSQTQCHIHCVTSITRDDENLASYKYTGDSHITLAYLEVWEFRFLFRQYLIRL